MRLKNNIISGLNLYELVLASCLLFISLAILNGMLFFLFYKNPAILFNEPMKTEKLEYKTDEDILMTADFCKYTKSPYVMYRSWIDGVIYQEPPVRRSGSKEGCRINSHLIKIPNKLPVGKYHISYKFVYNVAPFITRIHTIESNNFEIVR